MKTALQKNLEFSEKYHQKNLGETEIPKMINYLIPDAKNIIDLGCGDGALISAVNKRFPNKKIIGVDISPRRINLLKERFPSQKFVCTDICNTNLKDESFNMVVSTQVIEHVEDDKKMIDEINRLLKSGGHLYVTSVIKKPWAVYKFRNKGKFVLDPTHEREYRNKEEFLNLFRNNFRLIKTLIYPVYREKFHLTIKIPGYYIIEGLWIK